MSSSKSSRSPSVAKLRTYGRGGLDRIAKRRYTRDLFDGIVNYVPIYQEDSHRRNSITSVTVTIVEEVTEDERLITLLRCFNNFFNKTFDEDRLFKALQYIESNDRSKILSSWLNQKKADNIYVVGRFILQISNFMESSTKMEPSKLQTLSNIFNLIFQHTSTILDENYILIFSFLTRKGFFRSMMGFINKNFVKSSLAIEDNSVVSSSDKMELWLDYIRYPLIFAVNWRTKVEQWLKKEIEHKEIYGSNGSLDEDYASCSIMNQSIISVSSEYSPEDTSSRQTRIFLKRLLSAFFNSIYFHDSFFQYYPIEENILLANSILVDSVPLYLIILALVEPTRFRRKQSIDSLIGSRQNLSVQYKLNVMPSIGALHLFAHHICWKQHQKYWEDIKQEEAYGIIMFFYLLIHNFKESRTLEIFTNATATQSDETVNGDMKMFKESQSDLSLCSSSLFEIAFFGLLDPDVVLPVAYLYQYLKIDLQINKEELFRCKLLLSSKVGYLRYLWSLLLQCSANQSSSVSSYINGTNTTSNQRNSIVGELLENSNCIVKLLANGQLLHFNDTVQFLLIQTTFIECMVFHLNTLYRNECHSTNTATTNSNNPNNHQHPIRRKTQSSMNSHQSYSSSKVIQWHELCNISAELFMLSNGLLALLFDYKSTVLNNDSCGDTKNTRRIIMHLETVNDLIRGYFVHFHKLNTDRNPLNLDTHQYIDLQDVCNQSNEIYSFFKSISINGHLSDKLAINKRLFQTIMSVRQYPFVTDYNCRKKLVQSLLDVNFTQYQKRFDSSQKRTSHKERITLNLSHSNGQKNTLFQAMFLNISNIESVDPSSLFLVEGKQISYKQLLIQGIKDGLDSSTNHLFVCEAEQQSYPNPYIDEFYEDSQQHYHYLGRLLALNILNGSKLSKRFSLFFIDKLIVNQLNLFNINDLGSVDMEVSKNLMLLSKAEDGLECFNFKFELIQNSFGKSHRHEIVTNGEKIPVTNDNKTEYIHRVVEFILDKQIHQQINAFRNGVNSILPIDIFSLFTSCEFQKFISP